MLKGITVVLHERIENGKDAFNRHQKKKFLIR